MPDGRVGRQPAQLDFKIVGLRRADPGIALLPAFLEHSCPELQPLSAHIPELRTPLWVITHKELAQTMRIQVVMQAIGPVLAHAVKAPVGQRAAAKA